MMTPDRTCTPNPAALLPDAEGQAVRAMSHGGRIFSWMDVGTVSRFTPDGDPVITIHARPGHSGGMEITDYGSHFRQVDGTGQWLLGPFAHQ